MICRLCLAEGVLSEALGKQFYYCRGCKIEIVDLSEPEEDEEPFDSSWPPGLFTTNNGGTIRFNRAGTVRARMGLKYCKGSGKIDSECDCMSCRMRYS